VLNVGYYSEEGRGEGRKKKFGPRKFCRLGGWVDIFEWIIVALCVHTVLA